VSAASAVSRVGVEIPGPIRRDVSESSSIAEKIRIHGFVLYPVRDSAQFPWIRKGDSVFIRRSSYEAAAAGDMILFQSGGSVAVGRVIRLVSRHAEGKSDYLLVVAGSSRGRPDLLIPAREFLGRAIRIHRGRKHIDLDSAGRRAISRIAAAISAWNPPARRRLRFLMTP